MEDRAVGSKPVSDQPPANSKGDPFDPPPSSGGPLSDDRPVPPGSYDVDTAPRSPSSDPAKK